MTRTKTGHWRDSPENGTPHDRDMDRDIGGLSPVGGAHLSRPVVSRFWRNRCGGAGWAK